MWYAPKRDITGLVPVMVKHVLGNFYDQVDKHAKLRNMEKDWTDEDIKILAEGLADFLSKDVLTKSFSLDQALNISGLDKVPAGLRIVFMSLLGELLMGSFWYCVRETIFKTDDKIEQFDIDAVVDAADKILEK